MTERYQLIRAIYDYEGVFCNEVDNREMYARLRQDENEDDYILAIVRDFKGKPVTCHMIMGDTKALKHFAELEVKLRTIGEKYATATQVFDELMANDWIQLGQSQHIVNQIGKEILAALEA